jgi:Mg2+/Co2+ transporter CorB
MFDTVTVELVLTGLVLLVLLCLSAFFSGSETALTAASRARMHALEREGDERAARVTALIDRKERLIGGILLGNNLVNNMATALTTATLVTLFGNEGSTVAMATGLITILILVFSEVLPKTYAISNPDRFAMFVSRPIGIVVTLLSPIVAAVQAIVAGTLKLFGAKVEGPVLSAHDEIRGAIDLHHSEGAVVKGDRDMLGGVLDLKELTVADVMLHRKSIEMIDASLSPREIFQHVLTNTHTRLPLYRGDQDEIVGILHAKDMLQAVARVDGAIDKLDVNAVLREPWFVPETTSLQEQLDAFLRRRTHFALVVDEYGALMGLLTLEDILEEIVGDIRDEHDVVLEGVRPQPDGSVNVDGWVPIRDINRAMDWNLPDDEAVTVAGLVIHEARAIPDPGQRFAFHGYRFDILRRSRNQITALHILRLEEEEEG